MSFAFTGPPSAVIANNNAPHVPTPGDGNLGSLNSHTRTTVVNARLRALPLPDRADNSFEKAPLFTIQPDKYCDETHSMVVSLDYLNWALRQAAHTDKNRQRNLGARGNNKRGAPDDHSENTISGIFHGHVGDDGVFRDIKVAEVAEMIRYVGYQVAGLGNVPERTQGIRLGKFRLMTSQLQGEIDHVPNIFRPQVTMGKGREEVATLEQGDAVGFMIKRIPWKGNLTNWAGEEVSANTDVGGMADTVIQVLGVAGHRGAVPQGTTGDEPTEGDTYDNVEYNPPGREPFAVRTLVPAIFIPVGKIVRVSPHLPPTESQYLASYATNTYEMFKTRLQTVDIQLGARYPMTWGI